MLVDIDEYIARTFEHYTHSPTVIKTLLKIRDEMEMEKKASGWVGEQARAELWDLYIAWAERHNIQPTPERYISYLILNNLVKPEEVNTFIKKEKQYGQYT